MYLFWTNCELDHFINGPPVYKLVGLLSIIYKVKSRLETRLNGLKAGRTAQKLAEWFANSPNSMKAVQAWWTNHPWPERNESWSNNLLTLFSTFILWASHWSGWTCNLVWFFSNSNTTIRVFSCNQFVRNSHQFELIKDEKGSERLYHEWVASPSALNTNFLEPTVNSAHWIICHLHSWCPTATVSSQFSLPFAILLTCGLHTGTILCMCRKSWVLFSALDVQWERNTFRRAEGTVWMIAW